MIKSIHCMENMLLSALTSLRLARQEGFASWVSLSPTLGSYSVDLPFSESATPTVDVAKGSLCTGLLRNPAAQDPLALELSTLIFRRNAFVSVSDAYNSRSLRISGAADENIDINKIPTHFRCTLKSVRLYFRQRGDRVVPRCLPTDPSQSVSSCLF